MGIVHLYSGTPLRNHTHLQPEAALPNQLSDGCGKPGGTRL